MYKPTSSLSSKARYEQRSSPVHASHKCSGCARLVVAKQHDAGSRADIPENHA
jgi:hypothetical protein